MRIDGDDPSPCVSSQQAPVLEVLSSRWTVRPASAARGQRSLVLGKQTVVNDVKRRRDQVEKTTRPVALDLRLRPPTLATTAVITG